MQEEPEERNERLQYARENARVRRFLEDLSFKRARGKLANNANCSKENAAKRNPVSARRVREVDAHNIGSLDVACTACGALHFACEVIYRNRGMFNDCCALGKVNLDDQIPRISRVFELFMREHPDKREERVFHENIR
ncbi:hypothetical protein L596_022422 [Steinernema carpocapsae]|uniref:Uncharacterized protein n=1 Tax=Steinernema carpocapsae TaxID=34508 RepID=A0A4U5MLP8_STECR|nr:hypothetical protein L596_022422 [Steinernema carpocapsae]